ncbi:cytochrome P450 [Streptomyces sp. BE308]|uniref:cytochrome P450 n=1 Tax=Streptomyces sp. BE308 TaxID=3002529 RepID=UPI002E7720AB|nr:cytochrome P450 [Streptomyces sp. BE308]MEE1791130.1 cytochrome P450 [Streptomyces sp. BE308]
MHTEVDTVLRGNPASPADPPRLELTERIITETLRLYPSAWFLTRAVTHDTHLGGYALATITARWSLNHLPGRQRVRPVLGASFGPGRLRMRATPRWR